MAENLEYNDLIIKKDVIPEIKSVSTKADRQEISSIVNDAIGDKATVVIWLMNRILWTSLESGQIDLDEETSVIDYWQEMRAFNDQGEVQLVRNGSGFSGRIIIDRKGSADWKQGYVDSISPLWGERENTRYENGRVYLEDTKRKIRLDIPVSDESASTYGLVTRSYILADDTTGLSGYGDYRFLAVERMEG